MTTFVYTSHAGQVTTIEAEPGESVMRAATKLGLKGITGECGGVLSCATCHVFVDARDASKLEAPTALEEEMLEGTAVDREENSRLSCQVHAHESIECLRVTLPEFQE
jgi:2Fe-2S ferredoxin